MSRLIKFSKYRPVAQQPNALISATYHGLAAPWGSFGDFVIEFIFTFPINLQYQNTALPFDTVASHTLSAGGELPVSMVTAGNGGMPGNYNPRALWADFSVNRQGQAFVLSIPHDNLVSLAGALRAEAGVVS